MSLPGPPDNTSSPVLVAKVQQPASPPSRMSSPSSPKRMSSPPCPSSTSSPAPPQMMSSNAPPRMVSLPPRPAMTSGPLVPSMTSSPLVPTIVTGCPPHVSPGGMPDARRACAVSPRMRMQKSEKETPTIPCGCIHVLHVWGSVARWGCDSLDQHGVVLSCYRLSPMSRAPHASLQWMLSLAFLAFGAAPFVRASGQESGVVMMTSQQDRDRQMQVLKISGFPAGPDAYQAATYDEAKATPYPTLPDPLVMNDGTKVTTAAQWTKRRAEIKELFDREVYGRVPRNMPSVKWEVVSSEKGVPMSSGLFGATPQPVSDIEVITKLLVGRVDNSSYPAITVNIGMTLVTPASATGPVPIVMQFGGGGPNPMPANATPNPCAPPPGTPPRGGGAGRAGAAGAGAGRGSAGPAGPNWQAQLLQKGWGYAMLNTSSIQADSGCGLTVGIIGLMNKGQPRK